MSNWSLVCFTLTVQSAIGLVWVCLVGAWLGSPEGRAGPIWPLIFALALTGLGLVAALTPLAKPRLAPRAFGNLGRSWLSREVVLVQALAGSIVLVIFMEIFGSRDWLLAARALACLAGLAALTAMIKVYRLKTVPVWNSAATPLEFLGSALLLGGALAALAAAIQSSGWSPALCAAGTSLVLGLVLKLAAIGSALRAEKAAQDQTWYRPVKTRLSPGQVTALRQGANMVGLGLAGLGLALASLAPSGPAWLWLTLALGCLAAGEVLGRWRFYRAYNRIGL